MQHNFVNIFQMKLSRDNVKLLNIDNRYDMEQIP